jgi:Zn-finger nucleic acid-binding protein
MDIAFERCKGCEGIWLDNGELEEIVKRFTGTPLTILAERFFSKGEEIR